MIFSAKKWNNGKELKAVMKVNTAISFDMMEAPLRMLSDNTSYRYWAMRWQAK